MIRQARLKRTSSFSSFIGSLFKRPYMFWRSPTLFILFLSCRLVCQGTLALLPQPSPLNQCVCVLFGERERGRVKHASSEWDGLGCDGPAAPCVRAYMNASTQILAEGLNGCREIVFAVQLMAKDWFCWNFPQSKRTRHLAMMHTDHLQFTTHRPHTVWMLRRTSRPPNTSGHVFRNLNEYNKKNIFNYNTLLCFF